MKILRILITNTLLLAFCLLANAEYQNVCDPYTGKIYFADTSLSPSYKYENLIDDLNDPILETPRKRKALIRLARDYKKEILERSTRPNDPDGISSESTKVYLAQLDEQICALETGTQIEFKSSKNHGIVMMRDLLHIPAPRGYSYVRTGCEATGPYLESRAAGATIGRRYVKIVEKLEIDKNGETKNDNITLSHEMIHSYINSAMGADGGYLSKWFTEGVALYYSHRELDRDGKAMSEMAFARHYQDREYDEYLKVFQYIALTRGEATLNKYVAKTIIANDDAIHMPLLKTTSYIAIRDEYLGWRVKSFYLFLALVALSIICIVLMANFLALPARKREYLNRLKQAEQHAKERDVSDFIFNHDHKCREYDLMNGVLLKRYLAYAVILVILFIACVICIHANKLMLIQVLF